MTTDIATPQTAYTVTGTGPYNVLWPFEGGDLILTVVQGGAVLTLTEGADWTVAPASGPSGAVTLSAPAALAHAAKPLIVTRATALEQGWQGQSGRERGLEASIDRLARGLQDVRLMAGSALRLPSGEAVPLTLIPGRLTVWDGNRLIDGPLAAEVAAGIPASIAAAAVSQAAAIVATTQAGQAAISAAQAALFDRITFGTQASYTAGNALTYTAGQPGTVAAGRDVLIGGEAFVVVGAAATPFTLQNANGVRVLPRAGEAVQYPVPAGASSVVALQYFLNTTKGAFHYQSIDTPGGRNDESNYGRGAASANWETDPANIGLMSIATGRGNLAYGYLALTHGHSNAAYGVASSAGGAGSSTGNPDNPAEAFAGYCADAYGKNTQALGAKSFARGDGSRAHGVSSAAAGRLSFAGKSITGHGTVIGGTTVNDDGLGAVALGDETIAYGNGAIAQGQYVVSYGGSKTIGKGVNSGSPLTNVVPGSIAFGADVTRATLNVLPGPGTTEGVGRVQFRTASTAAAGGAEIASYDGVVRAAVKSKQTNSGSGGSWNLQLDAMIAGTLTRGVDVDLRGSIGLFPAANNSHRLGNSDMRWSAIFSATAVDVASDARLKEEIADISLAELAAWGNIRARRYVLKSNGQQSRGYIAQEIIAAYEAQGLDAINAGLVSMGDDGFYGVNYTACEVVRGEYMRARLDTLKS